MKRLPPIFKDMIIAILSLKRPTIGSGIYVVLLLFMISANINAQSGFAASVGLSGGYSEDGYAALLNYNYHNSRYTYFHMGVFTSFSVDRETEGYEIPYNVLGLQPGFYLRLFQSEGFKPHSIHLGAGGIVGYEVINNGNSELGNGALIDAENQLIYGGFIGLDYDWPFADDFSLVIKANEAYHVNSDVGKWYPYIALGIRYYLY